MFGEPGNYFEINTRRQLIRLALAHPIHRTHLPLEYLNADEHYSITIRKSLLAIQEADRLNITNTKHRLCNLLFCMTNVCGSEYVTFLNAI
ncbi:unnamed protein product [Rotaria sordida]|uniref:Uncharacterized protein n=1 Tax=Rotaria sordida TaxID=392033 RepID=A0A815IY20_9BILA|nr:unnamed protein product [Rotaria sordida]